MSASILLTAAQPEHPAHPAGEHALLVPPFLRERNRPLSHNPRANIR